MYDMIKRIFFQIYIMHFGNAVLIFGIIVLLWGWLNWKLNKSRVWKYFNGVLTIVYTALIVYFTLISRNAFVNEVSLIPFSSFFQAQVESEMYRSMFMNVMLFVPLGVTLSSFGRKKYNIKIILAYTISLSILIESGQYVFHLGRCETDDVIMNTLGAVLGSTSYFLGKWLNNRKQMRRSNVKKKV